MAKQKKSWFGWLHSKWIALFGVLLLALVAIPLTLSLSKQSTDNHSHAGAPSCAAEHPGHSYCVPKSICSQPDSGFTHCLLGYDCVSGYVCGTDRLPVTPTPTPLPASGVPQVDHYSITCSSSGVHYATFSLFLGENNTLIYGIGSVYWTKRLGNSSPTVTVTLPYNKCDVGVTHPTCNGFVKIKNVNIVYHYPLFCGATGVPN